ncbi:MULTISPECIES: DUF402 domain-containing protein [Brevibacillus]|uniref:DUF402 domain-containing protein n=1 Tax=Brevibacillus TaxID=55080 RepID=UPI000D0F498D|nr:MULTISPECIES: DUF402 domain-containing protein [Brevibacillus]MED1947814.1 DUF402 domain-containing protein [Brevibacillus formosus]MED2001559.1 DUF402 domain-containing protein [Brevibacillus formosus]MED2085129.1 DUF402 domain-containing protein [Brevibacillus formosus]PSK02333.1 DUF402 domain-containing protein [Brevibacillus sp. NRRL NRS-603]
MKRKRADRPGWRRVKRLGYQQKWVEALSFSGYTVRLTLDEVSEPAYMSVGDQTMCVGNRGYVYLQYFPHGQAYAVTKMLDELGNTVQWYIDICRGHGKDENGHIWYDDLYLDIVVLPTGEVYLLDQDELDEALKKGVITSEDYQFATETADLLLRNILAGKRDDFDFPNFFA